MLGRQEVGGKNTRCESGKSGKSDKSDTLKRTGEKLSYVS